MAEIVRATIMTGCAILLAEAANANPLEVVLRPLTPYFVLAFAIALLINLIPRRRRSRRRSDRPKRKQSEGGKGGAFVLGCIILLGCVAVILPHFSLRSLGLFLVCAVVGLALTAALFIVVAMLRNRIRSRQDMGTKAVPAAKPNNMQFDVAAMKAWEFHEEAKEAKSSFVDNRQVEEWKERYASAFEVLKSAPDHRMTSDLRVAAKAFADLRGCVDQWNSEFVAAESARCDELLGRLDARQREACVSDEVATLVVAGAGSGKTSTIQKKVEYLVRVKGIAPDDILLLSFTNKAADEMTARLAESMPQSGMKASTFHKFGLGIVKSHKDGSYEVCGDNFCTSVVLRSLSPEAMTDDECRGALRFFAFCANAEPEDEKKFASHGDYIDATRSADFSTLRGMVDFGGDAKTTFAGEKVKSFEELEIANWLYLNGISYEYERKYDKPIPDGDARGRRAYKPDFYLPAYDIWIEHFGVDKHGDPPSFFSPEERREYVDGMKWKRRLHAANGTVLVESYSWWHADGKLVDNLWDRLKAHGVKRSGINPRATWSKLVEARKNTSLREFARLVSSFISLAKSKRVEPDNLDAILGRAQASGYFAERATRFFEIVHPMYRRYVEALKEENAIDFHDMINMAANHVRENPESMHRYRYVIIDEFQDISESRAYLIRAVVAATGSKLFCVGDDWQSIYRFAGSDISLFTDFASHFGFARIVKLENTYRNSQELLSVAGQFIMKNPRQIKKDLKSQFHYDRPVSCVSYKDKDEIGSALFGALEEIAGEARGSAVSVMLLGRHNKEAEWVAGVDGITEDGSQGRFVWSKHPELKLSFLTVHAAKGLEADYVVILNFRSDLLGFPNMIADDPLLKLLLSGWEGIPFAEERRVFYVALTRARRRVFILVPDKNASVFLNDLPEEVRQACSEDGAATCPKCKKGRLVLRSGDSKFYGCTNYPRCDYTLPVQRVPITSQTPRCHCGGFLVPCHNPRNGEDFLGCTEYRRLRSVLHLQRPLPKDSDNCRS